MRKLLITLAAVAITGSAFATEVVAATNGQNNNFDSTRIMCGSNHIGDGINAKQLGDMHCKEFQDHKTNVVFFDDNSKKLVHCKSDRSGNIVVAECKAN